MPASIIDTPWRTTARLSQLRSAGVRTIIRYFNRQNSSSLPEKRIEAAEAKAIAQAGMRLAIVYQQRQNQIADFSLDKGRSAGQRAASLAVSNTGQPTGSAIYFSVDFDAVSSAHLEKIQSFFRGVREGFESVGAPYEIGAYGSGRVLESLGTAGLATRFWLAQSTGWTGYQAFKNSNRWHLLQGPATNIGGIDCDTNKGNPALPDFGSFVPNL